MQRDKHQKEEEKLQLINFECIVLVLCLRVLNVCLISASDMLINSMHIFFL